MSVITESDLRQFHGTEQWFQHWTRALIYTEGIHYLEQNGAGWLVDAIASYQLDPKLNKGDLRDFQLWELKVKDNTGVLTCRADSGVKPVVTQNFEYTDFPLAEITLYVEAGEAGRVLMLTSER